MKPYWSNCLIEGLKRKITNPCVVELKVIVSRNGLHVMWYDSESDVVRHFTHKTLEGRSSDLFFSGIVETMSVERFNAYCDKRNRPGLKITKRRG